jgi:Tfp pilus assembly protein PilO
VVLLLTAIPLLMLIACYGYAFKPALAQWRQLAAANRELAPSTVGGESVTSELERARHEVEKLVRRLQGADALPQGAPLMPYVVGALDATASAHAVHLIGVEPEPVANVQMFDAVPFAVEVTGSYRDLVGWLAAMEARLGALVVREFTFEAGSDAMNRRLRLVLVTYRLREPIS